MRYLPLTPDDRKAMLAKVGASSIDDLFVEQEPPFPGDPLDSVKVAYAFLGKLFGKGRA